MLLTLLLVASAPDDALRLKARAALALAFAEPTYPAQYAKAVKEGKPLVVFVGVPVRSVPGFLTVACATFPGVETGLVLGVPDGDKLKRRDLPATATDETLRATARTPTQTAGLLAPGLKDR